MIDLVTLTGVKYDIDDATRRYAVKKISRLDKYMPRQARKEARADIVLSTVNRAHGNKYEVEVTITLPSKIFTANDSTVNALAAIDIVEAKLAKQLAAYKVAFKRRTGRRALMARLRRKSD